MNTYRKRAFSLVILAFFMVVPTARAVAAERYLIKTDSHIWRDTLGIRHDFGKSFSTDLSDFQLKLIQLFGIQTEPVKALQILPATMTEQADAKESKSRISTSGKTTARPVPSDQTPWGIETIYNDPLITKTSGGAHVNVAVLDTGVNITHPDLKSRIAQCKDFTTFKALSVDGKCVDRNGHGTHVTGIVAADGGSDGKGIYGVAPETNIFAYKVCGDNGSCYADDIADGIMTATDQGANVINMSFGSDTDTPLIHDAVDYASAHGVLMVAAAGNDGPFPDSIDYPGALASVIAVGALNQSLAVTSWSSRGINEQTTPFVVEDHDIEFAAPGDHIESTSKSGGYVVLSGTSMASPFIAGLAAKYWQFDLTGLAASTSADATRTVLHQLAHDIAPLGDDNASGFGLPQVR